MSRIDFRNFSRGLSLNLPPDAIEKGFLRRAKGVHSILTGSIRSRAGSQQLLAQTAHSLFRFSDERVAGSGTGLLFDGTAVTAIDAANDPLVAMDGTNLTFVNMQTLEGTEDFLFVSGGGAAFPINAGLPAQLQKMKNNGTVTRWGISNTRPGPIVTAVQAAGVAGNLTGAYQYRATFKNSSSGARSNPVDLVTGAQAVTVTTDQINVQTSGSNDPQVDLIEFWRTVGNGDVFFFVDAVAQNAQPFRDNVADVSLGEELRFDNAPPEPAFEDCAGPHAGRMWWGRINENGKRGRIIYSPIARPESATGGFIELTADDDAVQKLVAVGGSLLVFTQQAIFQVMNTDEPFVFRKIPGSIGTTAPFTVVPTPHGVIYFATDGVRIFDGSRNRLIGFETIGKLFRGEAAENLTAFEGTYATFARDEYVVTDETRTLAFNIKSNSWREVGVATTSLYWEKETDVIQAALATQVVALEAEGQVTDGGTAISFEIQTPTVKADSGQRQLVQRIYIEADTSNQSLQASLIEDGVARVIGTVQTAQRDVVEIPVVRSSELSAVRLTGTLTDSVEVFSIEIEGKPTAPST